jgi:DNA-binding NtrC family response regulator
MVAWLFIEQGPRRGTRHDLDTPRLVVGRDAECGLCLPDTFISRRQFQIDAQEGTRLRRATYFLENLAPQNVTLVNGAEEPGRFPLEHDDLIQVGATRLRFRHEAPADATIPKVVGSSWQTERLREQIVKMAAQSAPVLVRGDHGTGKRLVARAIHAASAHPEWAFLAVHSGAARSFGEGPRTIYFEEVGGLPAEGQAKLLALLVESNVRVVAGTSRELDSTFDHELAKRLSANKIELAPLCARKDDIADVARFLLGSHSLTPAALEKLRAHLWPGNVHELRAVLDRAVIFSDGTEIDADAVEVDPTIAFDCPRERIARALEVTKGKHRAAAAALKVSRSRFYEQLSNEPHR